MWVLGWISVLINILFGIEWIEERKIIWVLRLRIKYKNKYIKKKINCREMFEYWCLI